MLVVLGAAASFFSLSSTVPQISRAFRSRSAEGVSWSALLLNLGASALWAMYAAVVMDRLLLAYNTVAVGLLVVLAVALLTADGRSSWSVVLLAALAVPVAGLAAVATPSADPTYLAFLGTVISSVRMWPQARLALAHASLWGLDPWATALGWVGWLLWAAYGAAVGDQPLTLCSLIGLAMHSIVMRFRLPPRRTLNSIADGRLGPVAAQVAGQVAGRFPPRADDFQLVA